MNWRFKLSIRLALLRGVFLGAGTLTACGTGEVTDTPLDPVPPTLGVGIPTTPFDPAASGFFNLLNRDFNDIALTSSDIGIGTLPNRTTGSEGWDGVEHQYGPAGSRRLVQAAGEVRMTYPAGTRGGTAGMVMQTRPLGGTYRRIYAALDLHFDPAYWIGSVGNKLAFVRTQDQTVGSTRYRSEPILGIYNNGAGALRLVVSMQGSEDASRNFGWGNNGHIRAAGLGAALRKGGRYRVEVLLEMNSALRAADGRVRVWVRDLGTPGLLPELAIDRADVRVMPRAGTGWRWNLVHVSPTLGTTNPAPFYLGYEQARIWGK